MQVRHKRTGFTLVELLVVISIIGMLMALLLPAVQAARETGRANTCRNNMRNLALAAVQYDNRKGFFPGRYEYAYSTDGVNSWRPLIYNLAEYLERSDIAEAYSRNNPTYAGKDSNNVPGIYMALLVCPSDPQQALVGNSAPTAYVFNGGVPDVTYPTGGSTPWTSTVTNDGVVAYNQVRYQSPGSPPINEPGYNWNTSSAHISSHDGLTSTLLVSENIDAGYWNSSDEIPLCFTWDNYASAAQVNNRINADNKGQAPGQVANNFVYSKPTSNHPQSVNAAFCDAHVKTINENIGYHVYVALCTPWGRRCHPAGDPTNVLGRSYLLDESDY